MKNQTMKLNIRLSVLVFVLFLLMDVSTVFAQQIRWLRVTELQGPYNNLGGEFEGEFSTGNGNLFSWPAQYGIEQNTLRSRALWIGCKDFDDPVEGKIKSYKVVGVGPRDATDRPNQILEYDIKLAGRRRAPTVIVDDQNASPNDIYDKLDEVNPNLEADRVITAKFNTSIGISVTKKIMAFDAPYHQQYHVNDYVFTNTGIYNRGGSTKQQTLKDVYFYFNFRYCFSGESNNGYGIGWAAWSSTWGRTTVHHNLGDDKNAAEFTNPLSPLYHLRAFYSWYAPNAERSTVTYAEDWGCPNHVDDGIMASAKYGGIVTLHADKSTTDQSDDIDQPSTTWYVGSDVAPFQAANGGQYDEIAMSGRYAMMSEGRPTRQNDEEVGDQYPNNWTKPGRIDPGGTSQNIAYGPYTIAPGESIHIVFAEGVSGLSREKNREVSSNWIQAKSGASPTLVFPDGSTTTDNTQRDLYKRRWVETCKDSIIQTYQRAVKNYQSNYQIPKPPPPPSSFTVTSGGDRIMLTWSRDAETTPHFDGYVIYRAEGNVLGPKTVYEKIFECNKSNAVGNFDDVTAVRGLNYYYYIQSKDDGSQNDIEIGKPLYSSLFWTITNLPATLQRPAGNFLGEIRVVPNPYDVRSKQFQFGNRRLDDHDQIAFYGLPPKCKLKIFTERGDLVWEKSHTKGTGDELWNSETMSAQILVSGVYILYVEVIEDTYALNDIRAPQDIYGDDLKQPLARSGDIVFRQGELMFHKGDSKFRKFVIIR
jgi:hypothetical protein